MLIFEAIRTMNIAAGLAACFHLFLFCFLIYLIFFLFFFFSFLLTFILTVHLLLSIEIHLAK